MESKYIWMNGEMVEFEKATLHFLTPALHYGAAVFEGIRCYATEKGTAVFRLQEHVDRLLASARVFGFRDLPYTPAEIAEGVTAVVAANEFNECYIRPLLYLTGGGWNLNVDMGKTGLAIAAWRWDNYLGPEALDKGIRANVSSFTRHQPNVMMTKAKVSGNYANSFLAKTESIRLGFDEAIMLNPQGFVAECTGENIFLVHHGRIVTPPLVDVLEGITRDSLLTIAGDLGYTVVEQAISRDQLYVADEVFVSGTASEVIGLSEIDFRRIGSGKTGPVTRSLQEAFQNAIHGRTDRYAGWLSPVYEAGMAFKMLDIPALRK
jgi:branched-chain amino acid aminotransferase